MINLNRLARLSRSVPSTLTPRWRSTYQSGNRASSRANSAWSYSGSTPATEADCQVTSAVTACRYRSWLAIGRSGASTSIPVRRRVHDDEAAALGRVAIDAQVAAETGIGRCDTQGIGTQALGTGHAVQP